MPISAIIFSISAGDISSDPVSVACISATGVSSTPGCTSSVIAPSSAIILSISSIDIASSGAGSSASGTTASGICKSSTTIFSGAVRAPSPIAAFNSAESSSRIFSGLSMLSSMPSISSISSEIGSVDSIPGRSRLSRAISADELSVPISSSGVTGTISSKIAFVGSASADSPDAFASSSIRISGATSIRDSSAALFFDASSSIASALAMASSSASSSASFSYPSGTSSPILYLGKDLSSGALIAFRTRFIPVSISSPLSSLPSISPISLRSLLLEETSIASSRSTVSAKSVPELVFAIPELESFFNACNSPSKYSSFLDFMLLSPPKNLKLPSL